MCRKIITTLAHRAYRGTENSGDIEELLEFYRQGRKEGDFDAGIAMALERILAGPKFLVRIEEESPKGAGAVYRIGDLIWLRDCRFSCGAAFPTIDFCKVAKEGKLHEPAVLEREVRRMLAESEIRRSGQQLRGTVVSAEKSEQLGSRFAAFSGFRRSAAAGVSPGDRAVFREHHCGGSECDRSDECQLHVC